jgi:hypothetical protein
MKSIFTLLVLVLFVFKAKSQEFLNATKSEIKKSITAQGGVLSDRSMIIICVFPKTVIEKNDINDIAFFIRQDKCYKYVVKYASDKNLKSIIEKFDTPSSGYSRIGKGLNWKNSKSDLVQVLDNFRNGVKTNAFWLEISKKEF